MKVFLELKNSKSPFVIVIVFFLTVVSIKYIDLIAFKFIFSIVIFFWFILLDHFSKDHFFSNSTINFVLGHISSVICLVPYNQWKNMQKNQASVFALEKRFIAPINVVIYSMKNYWNIKRLFNLFPDKSIRMQFILSMLVMNTFFMGIIPRIPKFWSKFSLSYFLFLILAEIYLSKARHNGHDR